jgi:hypothetical protein
MFARVVEWSTDVNYGDQFKSQWVHVTTKR